MVSIQGVVALTDNQGGIWAVENNMSPGSPCSVTEDLLPGLAGGTRPFPPDAQVMVKDGSGQVLGVASLTSPTSGMVVAAPHRPSGYYCEFGWQITVPAATLYSFEFADAATQSFTEQLLPGTVTLSIGDGIGFTPHEPIGS
jgi:hypothetical protein